jgi:UDP:flavonoid glycosyltransferase YjiC (YdhE family)
MHIVMITVGSRGDVDPFVALGVGLRRAGHSVRLATHAVYEPDARAAGLDFAPLPGDPHRLRAELEAGFDGTKRDQLRFIRFIGRAADQLAHDTTRAGLVACRDAEAIIYRDALAFVGYSLAEAVNARPVVAALQPRAPTRAFAYPRALPFGGTVNLLDHHLTLHIFWQLFRRRVNRWRQKDLGLAPFPLTGPYADGRRRRVPTLFGFSSAIVPRPPDWPVWYHVTGFWFGDTGCDPSPPPALVDFLAAGPPPVYVGFGSVVMRDASAVTARVVEALERAGRRGVLATGWGGLVADGFDRSDRFVVVESVPHQWLFPRVAAVVHHGGLGTTAAGLRAGRPTIVVPSAFGDQPFWGGRVAALGGGPTPILRRKLTSARLANAIELATTDEAMRRRAAELGERLRSEDGVGTAVQVLTDELSAREWRWDR